MSSLVTSAGDNAVRSGREGSALRRSDANLKLTARVVGTLVNKEATSKETRAISGERV